jgi:hypothetical protein
LINTLTLRNFKSIKEQTYKFTQFDLLVGRNNSGKSTVLQALAIWQFCIDEFRRSRRNRKGARGKQVILPNFTALPVPEFSLLWSERTDRTYHPDPQGKKKLEYILIEIEVAWAVNDPEPQEKSFGIQLRYSSPQTIYAIPKDGWDFFWDLENNEPSLLPVIAYVPPFSGLEPNEEWRDDGPLRQQIGKAQPGSILRNLLFRVWEKEGKTDWQEIQKVIEKWFGVNLKPPQYEKGVDTQIVCEYRDKEKSYDIIAGGSGFHQVLTLLAFFYGYKPTTILLDEPDAHLHVNLQREILDHFKNDQLIHRKTQFLIATHAEEFIRGVNVQQIMSVLERKPRRVESTPAILTAMADVSNLEVTQLSELTVPVLLYVEGETDEILIRGWATALGRQDEILNKVCFKVMRGGSKEKMRDDSQLHFEGVRAIIPATKRLVLFDYDDELTFHPELDNPVLYEWRRKNIENYLLVPDAWIRAALSKMGVLEDEIFSDPIRELVNDFFMGENLTLPPSQTWRNVKANIFQVVNGKKLLFENGDSLFQRLKSHIPIVEVPTNLELTRDIVAASMKPEEIHDDVHEFFKKIDSILQPLETAE